jgi:hypothetical protein
MGQEFATKHHMLYIETSAKNGINVEEVNILNIYRYEDLFSLYRLIQHSVKQFIKNII